jgi:hypothetical protein
MPAGIAAQTFALAMAVPRVVAHRGIRMALAGAKPNARDRREFQLMGAEKMAAFYESWAAMYAQAFSIHLRAAASILPFAWFPWAFYTPLPRVDLARSALAVLGKGMAPVRRRAVANARRLGRTKFR